MNSMLKCIKNKSIHSINNRTKHISSFFFLRLQSLEGGFTVIGDAQPVNTENISHRLKVKCKIIMLL